MSPRITVVVCTYNRANTLFYALKSLAKQNADETLYEVLVVNNNSTDHTEEVARLFTLKFCNFRMVTEYLQGLSHARNRGYEEAKADWVAYIDDDARAMEDYVERILADIEKYDFDCFGGVYLPIYLFDKPKWFRDEYASSSGKTVGFGVLTHGFLDGSVFCIKKSILSMVGGFSTLLGMKGKMIGYGEETNLQIKLRQKGYVIGFDPELRISHIVDEKKLFVSWFLKSSYNLGKSQWIINNEQSNISKLGRIFGSILYYGFINPIIISKRLMNKNYYFENYLIETLAPLSAELGKFIEGFKIIRRI